VTGENPLLKVFSIVGALVILKAYANSVQVIFMNRTEPKVLFVNSREKRCGVYQFGRRIGECLQRSQNYDFIYQEAGSWKDFRAQYQQFSPSAVIWNHVPATMPWLTGARTLKVKAPNLSIVHEITQLRADSLQAGFFDHYISPDPSLLLTNPVVSKTGRLVSRYNNTFPRPNVVTIGSFGFGVPGKGFDRLVAKVQEEFDEALIRLHITISAYGDDGEGSQAKKIAQACKDLVWKKGIKIEISHHTLTDKELLDFLAQNSLNVFLYDYLEGRGVSSVLDYALAVNRPVATTSSSMFRHMECHQNLRIENRSLKELLAIDQRYFDSMAANWCEENLLWDYERIVEKILKQDTRRPILRPIIYELKNRLAHRVSPILSMAWLKSGESKSRTPAINPNSLYRPVELPSNWLLNRILNDEARKVYAPAIAQLFLLAPEVMYRKIPRANIQQAFVLDTVFRHAGKPFDKKILCVGAYEDSAAWSLSRLGYPIEEIDPAMNYDLKTFLSKPSTKLESYDIVFSTSVIEHVEDDQAFLQQIASLLRPGGICVLTCDYKNGFKTGDPMPSEDFRLYTKSDFIERLLPKIDNCRLIGDSDWADKLDDFEYGKYRYSFASIVFVKELSSK